jgi:formylglycine-generating enzyme required for sulfatase activity
MKRRKINMKKLFVVLFFLTAALSFAQQKYALVIGNAAYTGAPWTVLPNPVNDANSMEKALKELGFTVDVVRNGTKDEMERAVFNFRQKLRISVNTYGFFYYAGHGTQHNGENYLIPVNAKTPKLSDLEANTMSVGFVMQELELARNELNMIVLDACRNLPDQLQEELQQAAHRGGTNPEAIRGLANISKVPQGTIIMYATAANRTAADGAVGGNGLFTSHLLRNLTTPGIEVKEIFDRTGAAVVEATRGSQFPEVRKMYFGTAYLGSPTTSVPDGFVRINGGTFTMGSPANEPGRWYSETQHQVTVSAFYMGKYEVTQKEYQEIMGTNPSSFKGDNLPVENVSWYDAVEYCNKRSRKEGLTPTYTIKGENVTWNRNANGYRLPTEAEWEYACRAGTTTPFSTGNNITTDQANYDGNKPYNNNAKGEYRRETTPVGTFAPNPWGLYDMHGNVWEWCYDWYGDYSSSSQTDPVGAVTDTFRVRRGGSCLDDGQFLRSARRFVAYPSIMSITLGFRLVRP